MLPQKLGERLRRLRAEDDGVGGWKRAVKQEGEEGWQQLMQLRENVS